MLGVREWAVHLEDAAHVIDETDSDEESGPEECSSEWLILSIQLFMLFTFKLYFLYLYNRISRQYVKMQIVDR